MPVKWQDLRQSGNVNGRIFRQKSLKSIGRMFLDGETYEHLQGKVSMSGQGYEQLTLFQEDFLASHLAWPGNDKAKTMTVTSGQKCSESYENSSPLGSLVKMCLVSSIWHSTRCFLIWKQKVTPDNRLLFQLAASMPLTKETECALWPTPVHGHVCGGTGAMNIMKRMLKVGKITQEEYRSFVAGNGGKTNPELLEWLMGYTKAFTQLLPTPCMSHYKGAKAQRFVGGGTTGTTFTNL